jgi:hypothetical protein
MGLDMYLSGKRYMSKFFNEGDASIQEDIQNKFPELAEMKSSFGDSPVKEVKIEAGYWRKANAVHDWFVKHVQGGTDDCGYYYVDRDQLIELKSVCEAILTDRSQAADLLPTASGFFFGGTDYDEWYFDGLEHTISVIDACLKLPEAWEFEYHSSW